VRLKLFEAVGVEIEYMIVDATTLDVRPVADQLFRQVLGEPGSDVPGEEITWSNELVNHVVELKTTKPTTDLKRTLSHYQTAVARVQRKLAPMGARLMPSAMHPWMQPLKEARLWPGENNEIYRAFDRIFDCRGHGWSNLQSMHLNLPFSGDEEFARLHAAIRIVLPLLPALAASSPFQEGESAGNLDNRMRHYMTNSRRIPQVAGQIIPEPVRSEQEYRERIFQPMWDAIAPHDPDEVLREEWLNARGAIARFERGSIEIRVTDTQECPLADLAVAAATVELVRALVEERWSSFQDQIAIEQIPLVDLFHQTIQSGFAIAVESRKYLASLGEQKPALSVGELWRSVLDRLEYIDSPFGTVLDSILHNGNLAERLLRSVGAQPSRSQLHGAYGRLCDDLSAGRLHV
jgi:gamma-glutamyl:cysteine ligase YbdK (ATP-grasp superfamily)